LDGVFSRIMPRCSPRASKAVTRAACAPFEIDPTLRRAVARQSFGNGTKAACHGTCLAMTSHNRCEAQCRLILPLSAMRRPPAGAVPFAPSSLRHYTSHRVV